MVMCISLAVPAFAAEKQYEQLTIGLDTFEEAYIESETLRFVKLYDPNNIESKTVNIGYIKPGSQITVRDRFGDPAYEHLAQTWVYNETLDAYEEGWVGRLCTSANNSSLYAEGILLEIGDCFLKLGDNSIPTKPSEAIIGSFTDVKASAYYAEAVQWAVDCKVTDGTSATTFSPDDTCTRGQIVTFLHRVLQ